MNQRPCRLGKFLLLSHDQAHQEYTLGHINIMHLISVLFPQAETVYAGFDDGDGVTAGMII